MRKGQLAVWGILTFALAWGLFAFALAVSNRAKSSGDLTRATGFLLVPFLGQLLWFAAGTIYSSRSKRREPVLGILLGFGLEFVALIVLVVFSASSHY